MRPSHPPSGPENPAGAGRSNWLLGLAFAAHGDTAGRDSAWSIVLAADAAYIPLARTAVPGNRLLAETAHSAHPRDARACFWLAEIISPSDTARAVSLYEKGLSDSPFDGLAWRKLGDLHMPLRPRAALECYLQSCLNGDPGANGCLLAGRTAELLGDFHSAIRYYRMSRYGRARERADELEIRLKKRP
jgi:tetratricopeptide (TPR) repeat protein